MAEIILYFSYELLFLWCGDGDEDSEWECGFLILGISIVLFYVFHFCYLHCYKLVGI